MTNQNATSESLRRRLTELMDDPNINQITRRRVAAVLLATQLDFLDMARKLMWQGLGDLHDSHRKEYLESLLSRRDLRENPKARILIPRIVGCTGGEPALQVLAMRTLATMKANTDDVVDRVLVCLESKHDDVRMASIETLVALGPCKAEVAYELSRRLLDNDYVLAKAACQALGKQEKNAAVFVQDIVNAADRFELTAVQALATIGTAEARVSVADVARRTSDEDVIAECNLWLKKWDMTVDGPCEDVSNEEDRES